MGLRDHLWTNLQKFTQTEWQQCYDEVLDVEKYKRLCEELTESKENRLNETEKIIAEMNMCPMRTGYKYVEPSDYEGIINESNRVFPAFNKIPDNKVLRDKIKGAWAGRIFGCLLGKPVECLHRDKLWPMLKVSGNFPLRKYIERKDIPDEIMEKYDMKSFWGIECMRDSVTDISPADDDTNYTVFSLKLIETYGYNFTAENVLCGWLENIPFFWTATAEGIAYRNAVLRMVPPETATHNNPFREWMGAMIRGDFFGYINPGAPEKAAEYAYRDASASHTKNGIYGEMWVAAMLSAAAVCDDMPGIIETGLAVVPQKSRLAEDVRLVMDWYKIGVGVDDVIENIHERYDLSKRLWWCYTLSNAMVVTMSLLYGSGDYGKSICLAVQSAFDTDSSGATVGSVMGMFLGSGGINKEWAFTDKLRTSIDGYNVVTFDELTEKTMKFIKV